MCPSASAVPRCLWSVIVCCIVAVASASWAADTPSAILVGDTALVPLRATFEWLGASVQYSSGHIAATKDNTAVDLRIGSRTAMLNGKTMKLTQAPMLREGNTYIPLRFVAESFRAGVNYDGPGKRVTIRSAGRALTIPIAESASSKLAGEVNRALKMSWPVYEGELFSVSYPPQFIARSRRSDSVYFTSPDGTVEFYVFSARFSEESEEYKINLRNEIRVSSDVQQEPNETITYVTVKAKDGSYTRSYADILSKHSGRRVFAFKYRDHAAYEAYRPLYLRFKASLEQYADGYEPDSL